MLGPGGQWRACVSGYSCSLAREEWSRRPRSQSSCGTTALPGSTPATLKEEEEEEEEELELSFECFYFPGFRSQMSSHHDSSTSARLPRNPPTPHRGLLTPLAAGGRAGRHGGAPCLSCNPGQRRKLGTNKATPTPPRRCRFWAGLKATPSPGDPSAGAAASCSATANAPRLRKQPSAFLGKSVGGVRSRSCRARRRSSSLWLGPQSPGSGPDGRAAPRRRPSPDPTFRKSIRPHSVHATEGTASPAQESSETCRL